MTTNPAAAAVAAEPILSVRDLVIEAPSPRGPVRLVDGVSFDVHPHEVFGVVGESGSGKSITMLAVVGLLQSPVRIAAGEVRLRGQNLAELSFRQMQAIRGGRMSMIFQDPMTSLNPVLRVGPQIAEAIELHRPGLSRAEQRRRVLELLDLVGIPHPERRYGQYPNEFSGGMRQRAMIAMAIANEPDLLIADEPTTALDVTIQAQVMEVLAKARARTGAAMVLITHDLGLVAEAADRVAVLYGGRMMELSSVEQTFSAFRHPYTAGLLASLPRLDSRAHRLYSIPGHVPNLLDRPTGCVFHPRCGLRQGRAACVERVPEFRPVGAGHRAACHFAEEAPAWARGASAPIDDATSPAVSPDRSAPAATRPTLLQVEHLTKEFKVRRLRGWGNDILRAVDGVSFGLSKGETLGLVGESGCGKSTLGRVILGLHAATRGAVHLDGENLVGMGRRRLRALRPKMQVVFQDPYASLDPRMTVAEVIAEPLRVNGLYRAERIAELLAQVGLPPEVGLRRPPEFSGGQRQRIAIARALALRPDLLILDEAVSALDVSIQAQVINLLKQLQIDLGLTYLFISHDLSVVRHISDRVAVMYLGKLVETGTRAQVFDAPSHPYTQALLSAIPVPQPGHRSRRGRIVLTGDLPNALAPPSGCVFRTRCFKAQAICAVEVPRLIERTGPGHLTACHFASPGVPQKLPDPGGALAGGRREPASG